MGLWVLGAWLRVRHVGDAFLFGDEFHSLRDMQGSYLQTLSHFSETGAGLALPFLQKALIDLFGAGHWSLRAPAWLPGLLLLFSIYPLVRGRFGNTVALLTTAWVAIEPLLVFYSHFGRIYSTVALLSLLLLMQLEWMGDDVVRAFDSGRHNTFDLRYVHTCHSLAEVAFLTGFSEQSAFTRAFKRWSGTTPRHYRKSDLKSRAMQA